MEFNSVSEFLAMGRHGFYVWLSYGLTAVVVAINVVMPIIRRRKLIQQQVRVLRRQQTNQPSGAMAEEK